MLNRTNARLRNFEKDADYEALERILEQAVERTGTRLLSYCLMPNHWHLVVNPVENGEQSKFTGWLTLTHAQRWHAHRHSNSQGHVYQGWFKSFPMQDDQHFITVCRYVERNALRANLAASAKDWRWNRLWRCSQGTTKDKQVLSPWPVRVPLEQPEGNKSMIFRAYASKNPGVWGGPQGALVAQRQNNGNRKFCGFQ